MKVFRKLPLWLFSGILYGLSWPIFDTINLSFLAWFAFVPLFIFLEKNKQHFLKSMLGSYATMVVFGCFSAGWLFNFPSAKLEVAIIFFLEELWFFIPFLIHFFIQKKIGFNKSLWLLPLIWMLWEWSYLGLEFTMGTHLSAYSQSNNIWLIQYMDSTGMWGVSFWLMLFNVLIFKAFKSVDYPFRNRQFYKKLGFISAFMLGIPLIYAAISYNNYSKVKGKKINVSVIPTQFSATYLLDANNSYNAVEEILYRTDSIAFALKDRNRYSDLYLWPETSLKFTMQQTNLSDLLFEAVTDWKSALLTGGRGVSDTTEIHDKREYISGVLISHKKEKPSYHHKTVLTPGQEAIPYHSLLAKIPNFPIEITSTKYFKKGKIGKPLKLITKNNEVFSLGVSLCYEQWYPKHWTALAKKGADFYTHLAAESWYGKVGFMNFMTNVTRMRCIENRKQAARVANVGISCFIDQMGRFTNLNRVSLKPINKSLTALKNITFYAKNPNWFPLLGLGVFLIALLVLIINLKPN